MLVGLVAEPGKVVTSAPSATLESELGGHLKVRDTDASVGHTVVGVDAPAASGV
jgi:hypothetical protein